MNCHDCRGFTDSKRRTWLCSLHSTRTPCYPSTIASHSWCHLVRSPRIRLQVTGPSTSQPPTRLQPSFGILRPRHLTVRSGGLREITSHQSFGGGGNSSCSTWSWLRPASRLSEDPLAAARRVSQQARRLSLKRRDDESDRFRCKLVSNKCAQSSSSQGGDAVREAG